MSWSHWIIMPVVLPLVAGCAILLLERRAPRAAPLVALLAVAALLAVDVGLLLRAASGTVDAYLLGNWHAPFGIALALDRLSALMLVLTAVIALASLLYAQHGANRDGAHFHALFQFQLMGLNGAFLTADLFNLFVFFEVLLIASYGLLLHGGGATRLKAAIHYVAFNLAGSAVFLIAVALLYGVTGTLNMADLAQRVPVLEGGDAVLAKSAGLLLLVVFSVKAALLPLYFWLPDAYAAATAPVSALFAIMTKVGIYAIARVYTLVFGDAGGEAAHLAAPWLAWLALGTLALAAIGAMAATRLRTLAAYLVIASAGTLLLALGLATERAVAAGLFYLVPSTLVAAALFLVIDRIAAARPTADDAIDERGWHAPRWRLAMLYFVCAISVGALPPLAGFLGKAQLLEAAWPTPLGTTTWLVVLASGLAIIVALARAGSTVFWKAGEALESQPAVPTTTGASLGILFAGLLAASAFAGPLAHYTAATAEQLLARAPYIDSVLGKQPIPPAWNPREGMIK
jgi:multicomponent K+:H+ antiporter subunit D